MATHCAKTQCPPQQCWRAGIYKQIDRFRSHIGKCGRDPRVTSRDTWRTTICPEDMHHVNESTSSHAYCQTRWRHRDSDDSFCNCRSHGHNPCCLKIWITVGTRDCDQRGDQAATPLWMLSCLPDSAMPISMARSTSISLPVFTS